MASMLIESMRDLGYSLETALADIVDNSIAADADTVQILSDPSQSEPRIAILDDGRGMTEAELMDAMRAGSRNPLEDRKGHDLGRFGLGLKTASFSQCRRLTVVTRRDGVTSAAIWDLDHVARSDEWEVLIPNTADGIPWSNQLGDEGTLVLWESLDRLHGGLSGSRMSEALGRRLSEAATHLELVFHRFLSGEAGRTKDAAVAKGAQVQADANGTLQATRDSAQARGDANSVVAGSACSNSCAANI